MWSHGKTFVCGQDELCTAQVIIPLSGNMIEYGSGHVLAHWDAGKIMVGPTKIIIKPWLPMALPNKYL